MGTTAADFLARIITGDETWVHFHQPETKRESKEWCHSTSPKPKKCRTEPSAGKVMLTLFWDKKGVILEHPHLDSTYHSARYTAYSLGPSKQETPISLRLMAEIHPFSERLNLIKLKILFKIAVMLRSSSTSI
jgi:hypothetical protein